MEIEFNNVSVVLRRKTPLEYTAVQNLTFKLESNKIYSFLGNSGSGKSVIAELISFLIKPTFGTVRVGNFVTSKNKIKNINDLRSMVGYVFKNPNDMFLTNNVKKELEFGMKYYNYKLSQIEKHVEDALVLVGLDKSYLQMSIDELSLSEKKKVALASTLVYNPKIIILDEITIGMNEREKKDLIRMIKLMKNKFNKTIIILSKDTNFVYEVTDYVYVMNEGKIVESGNEKILTNKSMLDNYNLNYPNSLNFVSLAKEKKNIDLDCYKDIKDLIKGVYRSVF